MSALDDMLDDWLAHGDDFDEDEDEDEHQCTRCGKRRLHWRYNVALGWRLYGRNRLHNCGVASPDEFDLA